MGGSLAGLSLEKVVCVSVYDSVHQEIRYIVCSAVGPQKHHIREAHWDCWRNHAPVPPICDSLTSPQAGKEELTY